MAKLSVVIITHQEEENILRCLDSVKALADEIVVVDSNSRDRTAEICRSKGCRVFTRDFDGYGTQKQFAVDQASNNWVLSLDADEVVTAELTAEIKHLLGDESKSVAGYRIPFSFFYLGRILKHTRADHLRLFDRRKGRFTTVPVHEGIVVDGDTGKTKGKIIHYSYRDIAHHLQKINIYTSQAAMKNIQENRSYSKFWVAFKLPVSFFTFYFLRLGFLDGYPGFLWSLFAAFYGSLKIAKTIEKEAGKP
jgi:glycosyltransferase involved in cell wall biosynthesis